MKVNLLFSQRLALRCGGLDSFEFHFISGQLLAEPE